MKKIDLTQGWELRHYQAPMWRYLAKGGKRAVWCAHRRSGKDEIYLRHNACSVFERKGNYWYLLPEYNQCRKAIWDAVNSTTGVRRIDEIFPMEIRENTLTQEMKIVFKNGSTWQLMGSDNYDALVGSSPVGLTFSEYALSNPSSWGFLSPILLENKGWAIFNSTPRGKNHFKDLCDLAQDEEDWFFELLSADKTGVFSDEDLLQELKRLQKQHGESYGKALWLQEYYVSFEAALPGAIWGEALTKLTVEGRIKDVPHDPSFPVFTAWDLGRDDDTAIWFYQVIGEEIRVINYYANNFKEIPFYASVLRGEEDFEMKEYNYGTHWVPHDAKPKRLGMGGKSILQQFLEEDVGQFALTPNLSVEDGIQAGNATFRRCVFDRRCLDGIEHLKSYVRKYDEVKKTFSTTPVHDSHSHAADSWRMLSLTWRQSKVQSVEMTQSQKFNAGNVTNINFGTIRKNHFAKKRRERANL